MVAGGLGRRPFFCQCQGRNGSLNSVVQLTDVARCSASMTALLASVFK